MVYGMDTYLKMLGESLDKKIAILERIMQIDQNELELLKKEQFDMDGFDKSVDEKLKLMGQIDKLDEGFEMVYDRIRTQMLERKAEYAVQIKHLQQQISRITEMNVSIQALESRIKLAMDSFAKRENTTMNQRRNSGKAAQSYFNNMRKLNVVDSHFMDSKK